MDGRQTSFGEPGSERLKFLPVRRGQADVHLDHAVPASLGHHLSARMQPGDAFAIPDRHLEPTQLVAAFRATLEEVLEADIILHVRDISHEDAEAQERDVEDLLVRFMRGSIKGWEWAAANPEGAAKMTVDKYGREDLTIEQQTAEGKAQVSDIVTEDTDEKGLFTMDSVRWDEMIAFLEGSGGIKGTIPAADIMTDAIQTKAMDGKSKLLTQEELNREFA